MNEVLEFLWDGEISAMRPLPWCLEDAKKRFKDGGIYKPRFDKQPSDVSRRHMFAELEDAWKNLPEAVSNRFLNSQHFRKWLLIRCGYCTMHDYVFSTHRDAIIMAHVAGKNDPYSVYRVHGRIVTQYVAVSQKNMDHSTFQKSKSDILDEATALIGVTRKDLSEATSNS